MTVLLRGKGKDRQAPERNWTCSYTTTGSWQRLGKRLGSPGEAWSQSRPSCARRWNRHTAPSLSRLPPPSSPLSNSFKQPLTSFLTHRRSILPLSPLLPHLKGVKTRTAVRCYNVFPKFPEKLPAAGCQVPVGHVCVCVWEPCCVLSDQQRCSTSVFHPWGSQHGCQRVELCAWQDINACLCTKHGWVCAHVRALRRAFCVTQWPVWWKRNAGLIWDTVFNHNNKSRNIRSTPELF